MNTFGTAVNLGGARTTSPNLISSRPRNSTSSSVLGRLFFFFLACKSLRDQIVSSDKWRLYGLKSHPSCGNWCSTLVPKFGNTALITAEITNLLWFTSKIVLDLYIFTNFKRGKYVENKINKLTVFYALFSEKQQQLDRLTSQTGGLLLFYLSFSFSSSHACQFEGLDLHVQNVVLAHSDHFFFFSSLQS